jgi:hypothetical protein
MVGDTQEQAHDLSEIMLVPCRGDVEGYAIWESNLFAPPEVMLIASFAIAVVLTILT